MIYKLRLTTTAVKDLQKHKKSGNKRLLEKIEIILEELIKHPRKGVGKPEKLKYQLESYYSRRIDKKHRLIYEIRDDIVTVIILSAYSHYGDR